MAQKKYVSTKATLFGVLLIAHIGALPGHAAPGFLKTLREHLGFRKKEIQKPRSPTPIKIQTQGARLVPLWVEEPGSVIVETPSRISVSRSETHLRIGGKGSKTYFLAVPRYAKVWLTDDTAIISSVGKINKVDLKSRSEETIEMKGQFFESVREVDNKLLFGNNRGLLLADPKNFIDFSMIDTPNRMSDVLFTEKQGGYFLRRTNSNAFTEPANYEVVRISFETGKLASEVTDTFAGHVPYYDDIQVSTTTAKDVGDMLGIPKEQEIIRWDISNDNDDSGWYFFMTMDGKLLTKEGRWYDF